MGNLNSPVDWTEPVNLNQLLTDTDEELAEHYPNHTLEGLKRTRRKYKEKIREIPMTNPEHDPANKSEFEKLLERSGIDPNDIARVARLNVWQSAKKGEDGEWDVTDLHGMQIIPKNELDEQTFVTQAAPTTIRPTKRRKPTRQDMLTLCLGDAQIGFRAGEPFHDERAMELAQLAILELQPDNVIFTGDMIDLTAQSRWQQRTDWLTETQGAIDRYHSFLAQTRANAPNARIAVVHGNHEARMDAYVQRDAAAILGLRRANAGHELSVLTLQYLVRYSELEVESIDGYPNAALWLEDNIKVTHGTNVKKGGSNAAKYLTEEDTTTLYGHTHRLELAHRTIPTRLGQRVISAASPGCLCRTDGGVPGHRYSVNNEGETVKRAEDWQNGLLIVHHNPRTHDIHPIRMDDGRMRIYDKTYNLGEKDA